MNNFLGELDTRQIGPYRWLVLEDFVYRIGSPDGLEYVQIGKGFVTDFASIPRPLWWIWPPSAGLHAKPSVVHDCLYLTGYVCHVNGSRRVISRRESDDIYWEALGINGVSEASQRGLYAGVRVGGQRAWNKHRKAERDGVVETTREMGGGAGR